MATGIRLDPGALHDLLESPTGPVGKELLKLAIRVEGKAKRLLSTPGTGRVYEKHNPRRTHRASSPGDPPAVDTGRLRSSITHALERDSKGLYAVVGTNVEYAAYQEFGFRDVVAVSSHQRIVRRRKGQIGPSARPVRVRSYMRIVQFQARPFLRPALKAITGQGVVG